ncbi:MAG TPA: hypothetical protein V6D26_02755 [Stenomitos sp.]
MPKLPEESIDVSPTQSQRRGGVYNFAEECAGGAAMTTRVENPSPGNEFPR